MRHAPEFRSGTPFREVLRRLWCRIAVIGLWFALSTPLMAQGDSTQPVWEIDDTQPPSTDLAPYLTTWRDENGGSTVEEVRQRLSLFQRVRDKIPSYGFTDDPIWGCLHIRSRATKPMDLMARIERARLSHLSWYLLDSQGQLLGEHHAGTVDHNRRRERFPSLAWQLAPGEEVRILFRVRSNTAIWLPLFGGGRHEMQMRETRLVIIDSFVIVFCVVMALFVLLAGSPSRSKVHFFLSAVIFSYVCYFAIFHGYLAVCWPTAPLWMERQFVGVIISFAVSAFAFFNNNFLRYKPMSRINQSIIRTAELLPIIGIAAILVVHYSLGIQLVNFLCFASIALSILISLRQGIPRGERTWYVAAFALLGLMMMLFGFQFGKVIPIIVSFRDLQLMVTPCLIVGLIVALSTRQKKIAQLLQQRKAEQHAHELIGSIAAGTYEVSLHVEPDGSIRPRFHFVSQQYLHMFHITREELENHPQAIYDRFHPDDRESLHKANMDAITHKKSFQWEGRLFWDGQTRWIQASSRPRTNSDGMTVWAGVITDITSQKQAQEALQRTLENLPVPISCDDMSDPPRITMINEQFVKTFGYLHEEIPTVTEWAHRAYPDPAYREEIMGWWFRAVEQARNQKGKIESREIIVRCKDGTDKEIIISTTMLETRMILAFLDITERNRTTRELEALRTSREKSAFELTENMPAGTYALVLRSNENDEIVMDFRFISRKFLDFFGLTREQLDQDPNIVIGAFHPDDRDSIIAANRNAYLTSLPFYWEGRTLMDGTTRWVNIQSNPRVDQSGVLVWEGVVTDITAYIDTKRRLEDSLENEKQLRKEAEDLRQDAERAHEAKSLFLAKMSHEIRTPLSALVSLSQAMWRRGEQHAVDPDFTGFLNRVRSGGQYLNLILRNVLNISAAESGRVPVKAEEFYIADWVSDLRNILEPIAEYYRGRITWTVPADDEARWSTDQMRLTQIALNVCENALKYSLGTTEPVEFSIQAEEKFLEMIVRDFGPGIPQEKQQMIFASFSQLDHKISPLDEGVGLGLSVVKINTQLLQGEVHIENPSPCGLKLIVKIPRIAH